MHSKSFVLCVLAFAIASDAAGVDHLPFIEGVVYEYQRIPEHLGRFILYFSGTADIGGATTRVQHADDGQKAFWTETAEGDKLLHGIAFRLEPPLVFSPPILVIDEPLYVGKVWEADSEDSDGLAYHIRHEVAAFGDVAVPAGVFQAFTIKQIVEWPEGGEADKKRRLVRWVGRPTDTTQDVAHHTYADGIGLILSVFGSRTDELLSRRTVAVEPSTWSRIRMLYR